MVYLARVTRITDGVAYVVLTDDDRGELMVAASIAGVAAGDGVLIDDELNGVADNVAILGRTDGPDRRYALLGHGH